VIDRIRSTVDEWVRRARRTTPGPLLVRVGVFVSALVGLVAAWPLDATFSAAFLAYLIVAAATALAPRGPMPTVYLFLGYLGWLVSTIILGRELTFVSLLLLAAGMYLTHNLAGLAAVLPYDAVVAPGVLVRWLGRAGLVLGLTLVLALFVGLSTGYVGGHTYLLASLFGLALMATTTAYLARLVRRR
jgi:hypothetical protein